MATFKVTRKIHFGQTDAAGITYYSRFVEIINAVVTLVYIKGKGAVMKSHPLPDHVKEVMKDYMK